MLIAPLSRASPIIALLAAVGAANSVVDVSGFTLLQRTVPDEVLTRVLGVTWGLAMGTAAIGSFVAPAILDLIGLRPRSSSSARFSLCSSSSPIGSCSRSTRRLHRRHSSP